MKHEYLIELLKNNKTVILPNVGAFSNSETPGQPFIFNEYLKFNDGMMVKFISSKEGVTIDQAGAALDKFTAEFVQLLNAGKEVVIPGIGTLVKAEGKTSLSLAKKAGSPEVHKPEPIVEKKPEPVIEKKPEPIIEKKPDPVIEKKPDPVLEKKPEPKKEDKKTEVKADPAAEKKKEEKVENKKEQVADKKTEKPVKQEKPKKEKAPRKKRKLVWLIIILLLLGGGGTAGYIFREDVMKMIGMEETVAENKNNKKEKAEKTEENESGENSAEEANTAADTSVVETAIEPADENAVTEEKIVEEPVKEEPVVKEPVKEKPVVVEAGTTGNYYVIVGCFSHEPHAGNMMEKVQEAGMNPINVGRFNSLTFVAAGSATDLDGALQEYNKIKGTFPKAWIMRR